MSKLSLHDGRVKQKVQTRTQILKAAKNLMKKSKKVSLEDVAIAANVSRATIYRYFPNVELLCMEASLDVHHSPTEDLKTQVEQLSFEKRILYLQKHYNQQAQDHELVFRRYLSITLSESITSKKKIRGARRVKALKEILKPYKSEMPKKDFDHLVNIASLLMGIDALIVCKDVCGLSNKTSNETLEWGIEMILKGIKSTANAK